MLHPTEDFKNSNATSCITLPLRTKWNSNVLPPCATRIRSILNKFFYYAIVLLFYRSVVGMPLRQFYVWFSVSFYFFFSFGCFHLYFFFIPIAEQCRTKWWMIAKMLYYSVYWPRSLPVLFYLHFFFFLFGCISFHLLFVLTCIHHFISFIHFHSLVVRWNVGECVFFYFSHNFFWLIFILC